jgi:hypothetical protein
MPVREKRPRKPSVASSSLSHVPSPPQTAAKGAASSPSAPLLAGEIDSPLEGGGFEPSVPDSAGYSFRGKGTIAAARATGGLTICRIDR